MIYTTLNRVRELSPCADDWSKLLAYLGKTAADDEPLALLTILESNGLDDVLCCLQAEPQHSSIWRMYAVRAARSVQHLMTDERSLKALNVAERHARGLASDEELAAARAAALAAAAARAAARDADWAASWAAAWAAAATGEAAAAGEAAGEAAAVGDALKADFERMLAAHEAGPGESCALNEWGA
jgi:hypothetical protein